MKFIRLLLVFILFTYVSFEANAKTYYVEKNGNDANSGTSVSKAFKTLNKAFLVIESGDEILIGKGKFTLSRTLEWEGGITIKGAGSKKTIVQAAEKAIVNKESVFSFSVFYNQKPYNCDGPIPESLIQDICIRHGAAPINEAMPICVGGGIKNFAKLIVRNCIIENNTALNGGAIYNDGILILENTQVLNNHAFNLEGAVFNTSNAVYNEENCSFSSNTEDK